MQDWQKLMGCLPQPPTLAYDWERLEQTVLAPHFAAMRRTQQNPRWHGEGDVFTHTRMVCDALTASERFRTLPAYERCALSLAALLHDIGKPDCATQKNGLWTSPNHAPHGARLVRAMLYRTFGLGGTEETMHFRELVCSLIRFHMIPAHLHEIEQQELRLSRMSANGALIPHYTVELLCMLATADMRGRIPKDTSASAKTVEDCLLRADALGCCRSPRAFSSVRAFRAYYAQHPLPESEPWGEVVLLSGFGGTGKAAWAKARYPHLPLLCPETDMEAEQKARIFLETQRPFVFSAPHLIPQQREPFVQMAECAGASVRIVYLETAWDRLARQSPLPEDGLKRQLAQWMPPDRFEAAAVEWHCI